MFSINTQRHLLPMRHILVWTVLLSAATFGSTYGIDQCIECHSIINEEITNAFKQDIHSQSGLSCVDCHGGDATSDDEAVAMNPKRGFVGVPTKRSEPEFCGKCHSDPKYMRRYNPSLPTDQVEKYWTSRHGQRLKIGDEKVAVCASCHSAHGILPSNAPKSSVYPINVPSTCASCHADETYMSEYGIPTNQYSQYVDSSNVHGYALLVNRDIASPVCNDCHGNHGALPPGVETVALVCIQCHTFNGQLYLESPHHEAYDILEIPACAFCHQASPDVNEPLARIHTIVSPSYNLVGTQENAVCVQCHSQGDNGWETAAQIAALRDTLDDRMQEVHNLLHTVETRGLEISDAKWKLENEVHQAVMKLRTVVHSVNVADYKSHYDEADTVLNEVLTAGYKAVDELDGRQLYFYIITTFIALFVILLIIKIRNLNP